MKDKKQPEEKIKPEERTSLTVLFSSQPSMLIVNKKIALSESAILYL